MPALTFLPQFSTSTASKAAILWGNGVGNRPMTVLGMTTISSIPSTIFTRPPNLGESDFSRLIMDALLLYTSTPNVRRFMLIFVGGPQSQTQAFPWPVVRAALLGSSVSPAVLAIGSDTPSFLHEIVGGDLSRLVVLPYRLLGSEVCEAASSLWCALMYVN